MPFSPLQSNTDQTQTARVSYDRRMDVAMVLKTTLMAVEWADRRCDYDARAQLVYAALHYASELGLACGFAFDEGDPRWPVAYIELPDGCGQVSWHMPQHPVPYDGHSTHEKYERVREWVGSRSLQRRLEAQTEGS